jgi:urease accessory protein UreF
MQNNLAPVQTGNSHADFSSLFDQIGSADGLALCGIDAAPQMDQVRTFDDLKAFLHDYCVNSLLAIELPLISKAYSLASGNQFSELIEFDKKLAADAQLKKFALASQRVGQMQLKRLRPLRDQRGLQRYIRAVDSNEVFAWHTLIYGVTLASFSIPLRQGLFGYCEQVISGFVNAAARNIPFSEVEGQNLVEEICRTIPKSMEQMTKPFAMPLLVGVV